MQPTHFDLQPTLVGDSVTIRPLVVSDFDDLFRVASDPLIWDQHPFPRFGEKEFREFFVAAVDSRSGFVFIDRSSNKVIGTSRFYNLEQDQVFIGYTFLARSHWGGAFNQEIKKLMLAHAFKFVSKVLFDIGEQNLRSRRAIEKIGAQFVKSQLNRGKPYTVYAIDRETYFR